MPRKLRLQFAGALYHVINRGNYRRDLFELDSTRQAFEKCLFEACRQAGWRLHAYAVMRNHYHLALETPRANLREGMHWLQCTFSTRFNRFRREHGHLFQGRYKALLVEPGSTLARVVNYIHLNPVRGGVVPVADLVQFRWSSYRRFVQGPRWPFMDCAEWLREAGPFDDSPAGWRGYRDYLVWLAADEPEKKRLAFETLSRGWAIGSQQWRRDVADDYATEIAAYGLRSAKEIIDLREITWDQALDSLLAQGGKTLADAAKDRKGADWKVALAAGLRESTTASNPWIARKLYMGNADSLSVYLSRRRKTRI